jgi:RimJ/RimL family protein N-acetyltransferase
VASYKNCGCDVTSGSFTPLPERIETERLVLELRGPTDARWNLELRFESGHPQRSRSLREEAQYLARQRAQVRLDGFGFFAVKRRDMGDSVGYVGLVVGRATFEEPELAYELLRRAHGLGYATEASRAVVDAAFATGRHKLWATVRPWNNASLRVLDKLGFHFDHRTTDGDGEVIWLVCEHSQSASNSGCPNTPDR